jgi:hypothetical protein
MLSFRPVVPRCLKALAHHKGGFPFTAKRRAIDILRSLSFEIQAIKRNGSG